MDQIQFTLENGVDVLVYNGNLDLACNTAGNLRWLNAMRWDGQAEFTSQDFKPWFSTVNGTTRQSGSYKEVFARTGNSGKNRRLAFVTVDRSGHMVSRWFREILLAFVLMIACRFLWINPKWHWISIRNGYSGRLLGRTMPITVYT